MIYQCRSYARTGALADLTDTTDKAFACRWAISQARKGRQVQIWGCFKPDGVTLWKRIIRDHHLPAVADGDITAETIMEDSA